MENSSTPRTQESEISLICQIDKFFTELPSSKKNLKQKNKETDSFFSSLSSLSVIPDEILKLNSFKPYNSAHLVVQEKGKIQTDHFYLLRSRDVCKEFIPSTIFNKIFSLIRKSKNKIFNQSQLGDINLHLIGTFLAHTFSQKKHNLILIISRNDFLFPTSQEIDSYEQFCEKLTPHLDELVEKEFNLNEISLTKLMLKEFPFPLTILDEKNQVILKNDNHQSNHIKKIVTLKNNTKLITYDSDQIETTSSELFHFERITLLGELLNTLRHELNNPLFGLKLTTDLLIGESKDHEVINTLEAIKKNIIRCQNIIENFTSLYQNSNTHKLNELKKLIDESLTLAKSEITQVKVSTQFCGIDTSEKIFTNPISLVQIFFNLIVNSSQALRQAQIPMPEIKIVVSKDGQYFIIDLIDNGPGISSEIHDKLFEPFFTTKKNGTGLGLSITASLVNQLGGTIGIVKALKGAQFRIRLPILKELVIK